MPGLAGLGAALVRGAVFLDDDRCLAAAHDAAAGCLAVAPRVPLVTQCCGLAGVGELLLDLFLITGEPHYWDDANGVLGLILDRSSGSLTAPRFPGSSLLEEASGWGNGTAGVLAFLRRLAEPATPRLWMADDGLLRQ